MRGRATTSNARVRVSKDGDEAVCRHASRRRTARPSWRACAACVRCAASQHKGRRGRCVDVERSERRPATTIFGGKARTKPQRVARIRDSKSGQTIPKVLALRPRRIGRDRRYLGRAKTATCRCIKSSRSPIHCFRLFLSMEKATGACEAAADAQDRKIGPLMAKR